MRSLAAAALLLHPAARASAAVPVPADIARLAITALVSQPDPAPGKPSSLHHLPDYGVAIEFSAMYDAMAAFPGQDYTPFLTPRLDAFAADPTSPAYKVLHDQPVPWGYSIGDTTGLFPIAYLSRALHSNNTDPASPDWALALRVAEQYVLGWPLRLPDGTISRHGPGWDREPDVNASFLWQDDQFMGLALLARLSRQPLVPAAARARYRDFIAAQHAAFAGHVQDGTGLYKHGYNGATGDHSCCYWGRANGWVMMSHAEVAQALAAPPAHPALPAVLAVWRRHAGALAALQPTGADGRFHQVLDAPSTYQETSVTAMACYSIATGARLGFLDRASLDAPLRAAWAGVAGAVDGGSGQVAGICEGTPIGNSTAFYEARKTTWEGSSPGLGAVFRCAVAMGEYLAAV